MKDKKITLTLNSTAGMPDQGIVVISRPSDKKWWQFWKKRFVTQLAAYKK